MDNYKFPTNIGTKDLQNLTTYTHAGVLHLLEKSSFLRKTKWEQKYVVICKASGRKCTWNMCCYAHAFAEKADINYSMLEFESAKEYDNFSEDIIGLSIKFEEPTKPPLIFRCDTKESREIWVRNVNEVIKEAHKDSGYSSDTDRQSKKYDTINDVDESISGKINNTATQQDELDNGLKTNASSPVETAVTNAATGKHLDLNDDYGCETKHSYENILVENNSFKKYRKKANHTEEQVTNEGERQRNVDETDVKEVFPHPVQETGKDAGTKLPPANTKKSRVKKKKSYRATEFTKTTHSEHIYENTAQMALQIGKLKLDFSPEEDGEDCSHTDVKEVYRGQTVGSESIKHDSKKDKVICELKLKFKNKNAEESLFRRGIIKAAVKSIERGSTSPSESESQPDSPVLEEEHPYAPSVNENNNTNFKRPVAPLTTSFEIGEGMSSSFVSVQSQSESFTSVRGGTNSETVRSSEREVDVHSDVGSLPVIESHARSSLTRAKTVLHSNQRRTYSDSVRSANQTCVQEKQSHSMCEDTASFASVREGNHYPSLTKRKPNGRKTNEVSTALRGDTSLSSATEASAIPTAIRAHDMHSSSQTAEESSNLPQDEEVIYENTDNCFLQKNNYYRQGSESSRDSYSSSSIHSTNSSSSLTSRDSEIFFKYESPDESAHYQNIKFQKEEYFCTEKTYVKRLLKNKEPGTFLVFPGENSLDMCVTTTVGIKYFHLHEEEGKFSLIRDCSNQDYMFPSLDCLLFYYQVKDLPSNDYKVKLERGYKTNEKSIDEPDILTK